MSCAAAGEATTTPQSSRSAGESSSSLRFDQLRQRNVPYHVANALHLVGVEVAADLDAGVVLGAQDAHRGRPDFRASGDLAQVQTTRGDRPPRVTCSLPSTISRTAMVMADRELAQTSRSKIAMPMAAAIITPTVLAPQRFEQLEVGDGDREARLDYRDVQLLEQLADGDAVVERDRRRAERGGLLACPGQTLARGEQPPGARRPVVVQGAPQVGHRFSTYSAAVLANDDGRGDRVAARPMEAAFCVETLEDALARYGKPEIFNTDQGSQFTGAAFTSLLASHGIAISMDGKGAWRDNVFVERLWRSVKYEEVYLRAYESVGEARSSIGPNIRLLYGTKAPFEF